jgi:ketosteroid isomerase-like protein
MMVALAGMLTAACEPGASNTTANRPANAGNSANNAATAPAADAAAIESDVKKLANEQVAAILKNDTAALERLWGDNYVFISQDGTTQTKAQRIDAMRSGQSKIESLSYDEMTVRSNPEGNGAVLIGRATVKGTNMSKPVDGQMRFTQVWSKTKDGWKLVSGQVTGITGGTAANGNKAVNTNSAANAAGNAARPSPPAASNR